MQTQQQRAELHKTIWNIANALRGAVDGWDFKSYVLNTLFYRFISEDLAAHIDAAEHKSGNKNFRYAELSDKKAENGRKLTVSEKGFFILPSELFGNVCRRARSDRNLNETLSRVFKNIEDSAKGAESEEDFKGLFADTDVNSNKLGATVQARNELLCKILEAVAKMQLGDSFSGSNIDTFGDAYEFLISMYASNAGKSGGEYFTPPEVSELLAHLAIGDRKKINKVYDPACGSGSLLLKFAKILGKDNVRQGFFGQDKNLTIYNMCRINMFLHGINYDKFSIAHGDTLTDPKHWDDEPFDAIVSNPPYSTPWDGDANPLLINDERFAPAGVLAPKSKADLAFTMHMLHWLSPTGTAAIVEFPGVLYRGGKEEKIRRWILESNFVDTVIQLPPNLFFGTSIATCIIVLKKNKRGNDVLFVDASEDFVHVGNKNVLGEENRSRILATCKARKDEPHRARLVPVKDILEKGGVLSVSAWVAPADTQERTDIAELNARIARIVKREQELRSQIDKIVKSLEN